MLNLRDAHAFRRPMKRGVPSDSETPSKKRQTQTPETSSLHPQYAESLGWLDGLYRRERLKALEPQAVEVGSTTVHPL